MTTLKLAFAALALALVATPSLAGPGALPDQPRRQRAAKTEAPYALTGETREARREQREGWTATQKWIGGSRLRKTVFERR